MANFFRPQQPPHSPDDSVTLRRLTAVTSPRPVPPPALDSHHDGEGDEVAPADFDATIPWNPDEALRREMERLEAARHFPLPDGPNSLGAISAPYSALEAHVNGRPGNATPLPSLLMSDVAAAYTPGASLPPRAEATAGDIELRRLRAENAELTKLLEETRQIFEQATQQEQETARQLDDLRGRSTDFETLIGDLKGQLREKDGHLELLSGQIQELEQHVASAEATPPVPRTPHEDELMRMADELEKDQVKLSRDRRELEEERAQLREDEESLMRQMREMEVGMAKERAELARQRTELQRLHAEVKRELDLLTSGDRALTERMAQFQRRHQDAMGRKTIGPQPMPPAPPQTPPPPPAAGESVVKQDSGKIRRFFGGTKK